MSYTSQLSHSAAAPVMIHLYSYAFFPMLDCTLSNHEPKVQKDLTLDKEL